MLYFFIEKNRRFRLSYCCLLIGRCHIFFCTDDKICAHLREYLRKSAGIFPSSISWLVSVIPHGHFCELKKYKNWLNFLGGHLFSFHNKIFK